ncbi:MAG: hypothetical protein MUC89_18895 [Acetobacteraceae bacterium]|jgi:hypothetical protein|nr:hypothetical protein [Acetobacteraceae bacterium]
MVATYRILLAIDIIIALAAGLLLLWSFSAASALPFGTGPVALALGVVCAVIGGGITLASRGKHGPAALLLAALAVPCILVVVIFGYLAANETRWN